RAGGGSCGCHLRPTASCWRWRQGMGGGCFPWWVGHVSSAPFERLALHRCQPPGHLDGETGALQRISTAAVLQRTTEDESKRGMLDQSSCPDGHTIQLSVFHATRADLSTWCTSMLTPLAPPD